MNVTEIPVFYSFRRCPFAMRARFGLYLAGTPVRLREVVLREKPEEMLEASPKSTVPVMVLPGGEVLEESLDIMLWALGQSDPLGILPPEGEPRREALALINRFDGVNDTTSPTQGSFKYHLDRYKYATRHEGAEEAEERAAALAHLQALEVRLKEFWLSGAQAGLADYSIAPFVRQFANTDKDWFDAQELPHLQAWLARILASDTFAAIMAKYPQWRSGDPEQTFPPTRSEQA